MRAPVKKKTTTKKSTTKKTVTKKPAAKKTAKKKPAATKKTAKKATSKKTVAKKSAAKKTVTKKPAAKKPAAKKTAAKKTTKKAAPKKPAAKSASKSSSKPASKKVTKKPARTKKPAATKPAKAAEAPSTGKAAEANDPKKPVRKGITIVSNRRPKKSRAKQPRKPFITPGGSLLGPGVVRKPLIPSGPSAPANKPDTVADTDKLKKSPFNKRELTKYKNLLIAKRAELFGDVEKMESDALRSESSDLSHLPQHMADQGSDSYDLSLSLDLAAADRRLIKEIDDALARIDAKTYGLCERTSKPISETRLQELPWARYSIEAAREMERRGGF